MHVNGATGRTDGIEQAVAQCVAGQGALVVSVKDAQTEAAVANTQVKVLFPDNADLDTLTVTTDGAGIFTLTFTEMGEVTLAQAANRIQVADQAEETDLDTLSYGSLAKEQVKEAIAYFGFVYKLELVYDKYQQSQIESDQWKAEAWIEAGGEQMDEDPFLPGSTYRLVFYDVHSLANIEEDGPLGPGGDAKSKPADYRDKGWMPTASPTAPLYVKLSKSRRGALVPITDADGLKIRWKVTDPVPDFAPETAADNGQRTREFLEAFYAPYLKAGKQDWEGTVNCPKRFGGARENEGGIKVSSVVFKRADESALTEEGGDAFASRSDVVAYEGDDGELQDRGISKVLFSPPPIGGDAYVFRLSLVDTVNARDQQVVHPERPGEMVQEAQIGSITVWRRLAFRLAAKTPGIDELQFVWEDIKRAYAAAYIEIPDQFDVDDELTEHTTHEAIQRNFSQAQGGGWNEDYLLPTTVDEWYSEDAIGTRMEPFTHELVTAMTRNSPYKPNDDPYSNGCYLLYAKNLYPESNILGQYVGRGQFFMVELRDFTQTFAHELGHALYLRHALTQQTRKRKPANGWQGEPTEICAVVPVENYYDHDPKAACSCLMSYANAKHGEGIDNPVDWHFCSICLLKLRFWDNVKINDDDTFVTRLDNDFAPPASQILLFHDHRDDDCANFRCFSCERLVAAAEISGEAGSYLRVHALVQPDPSLNDAGYVTWQDVAQSPRGNWTSDDEAIVEIDDETKFLHLMPRENEATTTVRFSLNGISAQIAVKVVPAVLKKAQKVHPRRFQITPEGPPGGRQAQHVEELRLKGSGGQNWALRLNGLRCWYAPDGNWAGGGAKDGQRLTYQFDPFDASKTEDAQVDWEAEPFQEGGETHFSIKDTVADDGYGGSHQDVSELTYYDWDGYKWKAKLDDA